MSMSNECQHHMSSDDQRGGQPMTQAARSARFRNVADFCCHAVPLSGKTEIDFGSKRKKQAKEASERSKRKKAAGEAEAKKVFLGMSADDKCSKLHEAAVEWALHVVHVVEWLDIKNKELCDSQKLGVEQIQKLIRVMTEANVESSVWKPSEGIVHYMAMEEATKPSKRSRLSSDRGKESLKKKRRMDDQDMDAVTEEAKSLSNKRSHSHLSFDKSDSEEDMEPLGKAKSVAWKAQRQQSGRRCCL